jgi:hypothetical protein
MPRRYKQPAVHLAGERNAGFKSVFICVHSWLKYFFVRIQLWILSLFFFGDGFIAGWGRHFASGENAFPYIHNFKFSILTPFELVSFGLLVRA